MVGYIVVMVMAELTVRETVSVGVNHLPLRWWIC